jgi:hypothetical protein
MSLCPFSNIFGSPGEGVHSFRIFGFAAFDTLGTFLLALIIGRGKNTLVIFLLLLLISIPIHKLFCVKTRLSQIVS